MATGIDEDLLIVCDGGRKTVVACSAVLLMASKSEALRDMVSMARQKSSDPGGSSSTPLLQQARLDVGLDKSATWKLALQFLYTPLNHSPAPRLTWVGCVRAYPASSAPRRCRLPH